MRTYMLSPTLSLTDKTFHKDWKIIYYSHWEDFFAQDDDLELQLNKIVDYAQNADFRDFRFAFEVKACQFLCGVFPGEKTIRISNKFMSSELTLSRLDEYSPGALSADVRQHMNLIASIPVENSPTQIDWITFQNQLVNFGVDEYASIDQDTHHLTKQLVKKVNEYRPSWFEKLSDFGLDLTANFMLIRIHLLKFLAVLPSLDHDKKGSEVKKIFLETLRRLIDDSQLAHAKGLKGQKRHLPNKYILLARMCMRISGFIPAPMLATLIRFAVSKMATRFIAGENIAKANKSLKELMLSGRDATLDQLGELVVSEREADEYMNKVLEIIHGLNEHTGKGNVNAAGILKAHVSIKVSALCSDFKPHAFDYTYDLVAPRLIKILQAAKKHEVFINIDAEHYHYRDLVFEIYAKVLLETESLKDFKHTGIVVQAYLRDAYAHFLEVVALANKREIRMPIRLVKGAYWDAETVEGDAHNFNAPQFLNKEETDIHFRQLVCEALKESDAIQLALASHNIQDHCFAEAVRKKNYPHAPVIEHQCLHMTYEALSMGLAKMGWATRNYIPIGNLLVGMAYLVRRIMENSSQVGILTIMRSHKKAFDPQSPLQVLRGKQMKGQIVYDPAIRELSRDFKNIYPLRTYVRSHFNLFKKIFNQETTKLKKAPVCLDGDQKVISSSYPDLVLGNVHYDTPLEVNAKIEQLFQGFNETNWQDAGKGGRFAILIRFADYLLQQRESLSALIMLEAGKTVEEALADVDEAIDFVHFYVKSQLDLMIQHESFAAKGVIGVIAPWNFPLAIPCGMTVAALAAGNAVILKPAEQTPLICKKMVELAYKAGVPESILQVSLGEAATGKAIVEHELISGIVFTGSKAVGENIYYQLKGQYTSDRYHFKPVLKTAITEMGGKNAIIVTNNCELDETVAGIIYSSFAHSGQKCSAASRIIIDNKVKESFIHRFVDAVKDLKVGVADDFSTMVNPLITLEDQNRVKKMVQDARKEAQGTGGRILLDESSQDYPGFCVGPALFEVNKKVALDNKSIAQTEVFGPVVHLVGYDTLEEAVKIFNSTNYALTGGIFGQSQDDIDYLMPRLEAGNLYINRPNTGARVAIEPFGGFKMSGTGPKAGSIDYLRSFNRIQNDDVEKMTIGKKTNSELPAMVKNSGLHYSNRMEKLNRFFDQLIHQYEVYFKEVREEHKEQLVSLHDYLLAKDNYLTIKEFPNRYIPGQMSFDKKDFGIGQVLMLTSNASFDMSLLSYFLINLSIGNGLTILCHNDSYAMWKKLVDLATCCGFSRFNLQVCELSHESFETLAARPYRLVLVDKKLTANDIVKVALRPHFDNFLRKIIICGENAESEDWYGHLIDLTLSRSFAINTMRHGAPLELTL
jgi:RHH-type proline utilization regulon transcriptional repressor/proline dehydrogenase/delta 1-pyrroline-5-carboxylate dehydrogenase